MQLLLLIGTVTDCTNPICGKYYCILKSAETFLWLQWELYKVWNHSNDVTTLIGYEDYRKLWVWCQKQVSLPDFCILLQISTWSTQAQVISNHCDMHLNLTEVDEVSSCFVGREGTQFSQKENYMWLENN